MNPIILRALAVAAVLAVLGSFVAFAPLVDWGLAVIDWIDGAGGLGVMVFVTVFAVASGFFAPVNLLLAVSGFLFGVTGGLVVASVATTAGAVMTLIVGRFVLRERIRDWMVGRPRFEALERAISKEGGKMSLLIRLVPILPFSAVNYAFAISGVKWPRFALGTAVGMLPICAFYVVAGAAAGDITRALTAEQTVGAETYVMWGVGMAAMFGVAWLVTNRARREMDEIMAETESSEATDVEGEDSDGDTLN